MLKYINSSISLLIPISMLYLINQLVLSGEVYLQKVGTVLALLQYMYQMEYVAAEEDGIVGTLFARLL